MADMVRPSGTVHWVGAGLSTGEGLPVVCDSVPRVLLWRRGAGRAEEALAERGLEGRAEPRAFTPSALRARLEPGDVVVSMLPAGEHEELLRTCLERRAHFVCSSYTAEPLAALAGEAAEAGLAVVTETGLDPGIDHLLAHSLVGRAVAAVGRQPCSVRFTSYCGGLPAVPNSFRYRFSWAPLGVLNALRSPARYVDGGHERITVRPWEATRPLAVGAETFEAYPNRDSVPFMEHYGLPDEWRAEEFVRGTLRLAGWREAWQPVFAELESGDDARVAELAEQLAARYPTTEADRDRVVLGVALEVRREPHEGSGPTGGAAEPEVLWSGRYRLDMEGDARSSAMARCVSLPLARAVLATVRDEIGPGLTRAVPGEGVVARGAVAEEWLSWLSDRGVTSTLSEGS